MSFDDEEVQDGNRDQPASGGPPRYNPSAAPPSSAPEVYGAPIPGPPASPPPPSSPHPQPPAPPAQTWPGQGQQPIGGVPPAGYPVPQAPVQAYAQVAPGERKSPGLAAFLSFLWPGIGQMYNGNIGLGLILLVINVFNLLLFFLFLIGFLTGFITWIFGIIHAHNEAQKLNRLRGYIG